NVLAAQRQPWLAIDPKPQVGDPAFDPLQLILQVGEIWTRTAPLADPDPTATIERRVAVLCERLGLQRQRLCGWGGGGRVRGSLDDPSAGDHESGNELAECARIFSRLR